MLITAADVNKLRQQTGAGMMDCKKALTETNGDFEAAIDLLRKKGQKVSAARAENITSEGLVQITLNKDESKGILLALACETEPVSKVEDFKNLAQVIMTQAVDKAPTTKEDLENLILADGKTIKETITELIGKIGEKIVILSYEVLQAEKVASYVHSNGKMGVLVGFNGVSGVDLTAVSKGIAMQIASMKPITVDKSGVDSSIVEREIEIGKEQARAEGKPEAMLEKIAMGKLEKFYRENTLLGQQYVIDNSVSISQLLENTKKGLTVSAFKRISLT